MGDLSDWQFDMLGLLDSLLREPLGLRKIEAGIDSRMVVAETDTGHVSLLLKPVGPQHAGTYQRWVTLSPAEAENLRPGPVGWKAYVVMIGLLPNGQPWWIAVHDRDTLRETAAMAERVERGPRGWFWRWDPGLLKPVFFKDLTAPEDALTNDYPEQVIIDQHGHYWRDYGTHLSMPPVSEENVKTEAVVTYIRKALA